MISLVILQNEKSVFMKWHDSAKEQMETVHTLFRQFHMILYENKPSTLSSKLHEHKDTNTKRVKAFERVEKWCCLLSIASASGHSPFAERYTHPHKHVYTTYTIATSNKINAEKTISYW